MSEKETAGSRLLPEEVAWVAERFCQAHPTRMRVWRVLDGEALFVQFDPFETRYVVELHYALLEYAKEDDLPNIHFVQERLPPVLERRAEEVCLRAPERAAAEQMLLFRRARRLPQLEKASARSGRYAPWSFEEPREGGDPFDTDGRPLSVLVPIGNGVLAERTVNDWTSWHARVHSVAEAWRWYERTVPERGVEHALRPKMLADFPVSPQGVAMLAATRAALVAPNEKQVAMASTVQLLAVDMEAPQERVAPPLGNLFDEHGVPAWGLWCFCIGSTLYAWVPARHRRSVDLQIASAPRRYRWTSLSVLARAT